MAQPAIERSRVSNNGANTIEKTEKERAFFMVNRTLPGAVR